MKDTPDKRGKINTDELERVKSELANLAERSRERVHEIVDKDDFEERLRKQTEELQKKRQEYFEAKAKSEEDFSRKSDESTVYQAKASLAKREKELEQVKRKEGFFNRLYRYSKARKAAKAEMRGKSWYTAERRRAVFRKIFRECFQPLCDAWDLFTDTAWNFICRLSSDSWRCVLFIADIFIKIAYYIGAVFSLINGVIWDIRYWAELHKRALFRNFAAFVSVSAIVMVILSSVTAYEFSYYGKSLGMVRSKRDVYDAVEALGDKLAQASGANVSIDVDRDITFNKVVGFGLEVESDEDILNIITYMKEIQVRAYAITIDGEQAVIVQDKETADGIISDIQNEYAGAAEGVTYTEIRFANPVGVVEVGCQIGDIVNKDVAKHYLTTGSFEDVEEGKENPLIIMYTTEIAEYVEDINYGTRYISNADLYEDQTEVISAGVYGKRAIVATITRINGEEQSRVIASSEVVSQPVDEVRYQGTKAIPAREGTGVFMYPVKSYTLTSRFGMRWGSMHNGIDLANSSGTKIYASDGGTVIFAGWAGTYGYLIKIDHGSFYTTYYGHCSKLLVSEGDQVYQGQNIALMGSTGRSTGPHVHFEIRYRDVPQNPLNYLE